MSIEEKVALLRRAVTDAAQRHARATAGVTQAAARADSAREDLQREFGVTTVAEAREKQAELERLLETEAAAVQSHLRRAGTQ